METLFFILVSVFAGYAIQKLERLEAKINKMEDDVLLIMQNCKKRKTDCLETDADW